jgi:rubrerythrin
MQNKRTLNQVKLWHELAIKYLGGKCAECPETKGLHIHHKDGNPNNNIATNLEALCKVHHRMKHSRLRILPTNPNIKSVIPELKIIPIPKIINGLPTWTCNHCGHLWVPRLRKIPLTCPKCKSKNWFKEHIPLQIT